MASLKAKKRSKDYFPRTSFFCQSFIFTLVGKILFLQGMICPFVHDGSFNGIIIKDLRQKLTSIQKK